MSTKIDIDKLIKENNMFAKTANRLLSRIHKLQKKLEKKSEDNFLLEQKLTLADEKILELNSLTTSTGLDQEKILFLRDTLKKYRVELARAWNELGKNNLEKALCKDLTAAEINEDMQIEVNNLKKNNYFLISERSKLQNRIEELEKALNNTNLPMAIEG
jgi:hypothetical protein